MGPRPLHLVDGHTPFFPSPPPSSSPLVKPNVRRHSSISYRSSDQTVESPHSAPSSPQPDLISNSSIISIPVILPKERGQSEAHERPPLTLVEKHADLLQFIAQKESKTLELRSQLAILEAEILQLKRKWERIVNRGFLDNPSASVSTSQGSGAVLEGIVEGVQGVGRFIAAGLAIGEQAPPSPSSLSSVPRSQRPTCLYSQSNSSSTTHVAESQSSAAYIADDTTSKRALSEQADDDELTQILMVHDTGATPTMSPNPAFERQCQQRKQQGQADLQPNLEAPLLNSSKLYRRKSRDVHSRALVPCEGTSTSPSQSELTSKATETAKKDAMRTKRATIHGTSFPPVSSIPGLAALTVGPASPLPSWVESVGKKWGELQRVSTLSKNTKRASILLSDVSQSIVSALSTPSTPMSTPPSPVPSYFDPSAPFAESNSPLNRSIEQNDCHITKQ
ncbi:hypothetical protein E4T56_gene12621 [Termitomyces sp. T112]|nr:hypothetical protein E4T56_gene12621 [Termitomyces sp. T112]